MTPRLLLCLLALAACDGNSSDGEPPAGQTAVRLQQVAAGLSSPVHLAAPTGDARLFVVEQPGRIRVVENGSLRPTPFLDITDRVGAGGERGLLSIAFHPQYAANGFFYVNYTDRAGDTRVERYRVSGDRDHADPASAQLVIAIDQPYSNHNGGLVAFGPDGKLYVGMGDGGGGGDPLETGQDPTRLLGKLLRLDVDGAAPYAIPPDNPYAGRTDRRPEIWAMGMRNPWRFSWDRAAGLLYVADVGQNRLEEVNVVPAGQAGLNYGWDVMEGSDCFEPRTGCDRTGLVLTDVEYTHDDGCSVTGGFVYRGAGHPRPARALLLRGLLPGVDPQLSLLRRPGCGRPHLARGERGQRHLARRGFTRRAVRALQQRRGLQDRGRRLAGERPARAQRRGGSVPPRLSLDLSPVHLTQHARVGHQASSLR